MKLWQDNFWKKPKKNYHKKPKWAKCYLVQRSQIESQLNGADGWELRTQWDILLLFLDILTKYSIVFSTLSRQHHSAVTQFGFFEIQINEGFFWKDLFFCHETSLETVLMYSKIQPPCCPLERNRRSQKLEHMELV